MKIVCGNAKSRLEEYDSTEFGIVRELLRFRDPDAEKSDDFRSGAWDGYINFLDVADVSIPTGLVTHLVDQLTQLYPSLNCEIINRPQIGDLPTVDPDCLEGVTLRDYQVISVKKILLIKRGTPNDRDWERAE